MTTPLSDAELTALVEQSPLFAKMRAVKEFALNFGVDQEEDEEDAEEEEGVTTTTTVVPVDVETLTPRQFVVYRFGCIIVDLISKEYSGERKSARRLFWCFFLPTSKFLH